MKFEAATIKDIAKALNLSTSTVSRALRDSSEISSETKKLVLEYAEKINYRPNPIALSLKERRSRTIGVVVCEIANSFFSQTINGIESIAYKNGYNVIITQSRESFDRELLNLQYLTSRSVDGLIVTVSTETTDFSLLKDLHQKGMPIVFFDRIVDEIDTHKVIANNFKGAYQATEHLIKQGYKKIALVGNAPVLSIAKERLAGYKAALTDNGIQVDESLIKYCEHSGMFTNEMEEVVSALLNADAKPDAIFAASDKITVGVLRILNEKKIQIPSNMGLVGFSNSELTDLLSPSLTVVTQPAFEMGEVATELLLQMIESKHPIDIFETKVLSTELKVRSSTLKN
jgi:LacI family transcriptional regulator